MKFLAYLWFQLIVKAFALHSVKKRSLSGFKSVEVNSASGSTSCLYVSSEKIWPYVGATSGGTDENQAERVCNAFYLDLAEIKTDEESAALQEMSRCSLAIGKSELILVKNSPSGIGNTHNCVFQKYDGTFLGSDDENCAQEHSTSNTHVPTNFVCKKETACNEVPGCVKVIDGICYIKFSAADEAAKGIANYSDSLGLCDKYGGYFPRITTQEEFDRLIQFMGPGHQTQMWLTLTSSKASPKACTSLTGCVANLDDWYWKGKNELIDMSLDANAVPTLKMVFYPMIAGSGYNKYMILRIDGAYTILNSKEGNTMLTVCLKNVVNELEVTFEADYMATNLTCPDTYPAVPSGIKMVVNSSEAQPLIMCPGQRVRYWCDAGGINVREDAVKTSSYEIQCKSDMTYKVPDLGTWPQCIDRLDCQPPDFDNYVFNSTWAINDTLTPPFSVTFSCILPGKKVISKSDLSKSISSSMVDELKVNCQLNGTYDINIQSYTCTNPCQPPSVPDPSIMEHDWNFTRNMEIEEETIYKCKYGRQLVSKKAFEAGVSNTFLDEIMSSCQVYGALNSTIGSYTCTRGCEAPTNYSEVFIWDWEESKGSDIGSKVNYVCNDPTRQIVNMIDENSGIHSNMTTTCLFNGRYDINISEWECSDCLARPDPLNSRLICESKKFKEGSTCQLACDPGYIPIGKTLMTCVQDTRTFEFDWNLDEAEFKCVLPIGFVIGGIGKDYTYLDEVEVLAPGFKCSKLSKMAPYPHKIIGASAGFVLGQSVVCGGAIFAYVECSQHIEGSQHCNRNYECVKTLGGSEWCTGPKTDKCYTYDLFAQTWIKLEVGLKTARVYSGSTVMPDGTFWILGGVGTGKVLDSTEILSMKRNKWIVSAGPKLPKPMMGHCVAQADPWNFVVVGGFSTTTNDYLQEAFVYNLKTKVWISKPWAKLRYGPIMDSTCSMINWNGKKSVLLAGGWNNSAVVVSELFDLDALRFTEVRKTLDEPESFAMPLPFPVRSSVIGELDKRPIMAGGVTCVRTKDLSKNCTRISSILALTPTLGSSDWTDAIWEELADLSLNQPKSSHTLLVLPSVYAPKCKPIV